ncbi:prolyl-tRNA synthetase, partial [mine drainage metagenome]
KSSGSEWYNEIIETASLVDKRYPVKGMNVLPPYGFKLVSLVDSIIREAVNSNGFQESMFPLLISRDQLSVEFEHVKGFEGQVFWVTRGGNEPLEVGLALRPTSEAAMYPMFSLWIRTHSDLPLKLYQIVNTYRYETKHTRAFIRDREIHFFEAHTAHVDFEDSERQMLEYKQIIEKHLH